MPKADDSKRSRDSQSDDARSTLSRVLRQIPFKIAGQYALIGMLWIFLSDRVLALLVGNEPQFAWWQTAKGVFFVTVTASLLAALTGRYVRRLRLLQEEGRKSEERLELALAAAKLGVWEWDVRDDSVFCSPECREIVGAVGCDGRFGALLNRIHPDDAEAFTRAVRTSLTDHKAFKVECRIRGDDDSRRWVAIFGQPHFDGAGRAERVLGTVHDVTERRLAGQALAQNEAELAAIYEHAPVVMLLLDDKLRIRRLNRAALEFAGGTEAELTGLGAGDVVGCLGRINDEQGCGCSTMCGSCPLRGAVREAMNEGKGCTRIEVSPGRIRGRGVTGVAMLASTAPVISDGRRMTLVCLEDITEQRRLERQFIEAQKLEAVGQLAGGVAHDFNNLLMATQLNIELTRRLPEVTPAIAEAFKEIEQNTRRATGLTRQLLLFSRRQVMHVRPLDLDQLIENLLKMIGRLLGEHIAIEFRSHPNLPSVEADAGMIEQVLMNLCINARDAMPMGGRLLIETTAVEFTADQSSIVKDARAGSFVRMSITDTGTGIEDAVLARIFEPFFTTKEPGKGTGLGLATVSGIVKQHHGWIEVQTRVGVGTSFRVHLPASREIAELEAGETQTGRGPRGSESVLLVEDEPGVRLIAARLLRDCGYRVVEAKNGAEAIDKWHSNRGEFHLLIADMVMPNRMTGLELGDQLRASNPGLKIIITSGYSPELTGREGKGSNRLVYLQKPCTGTELITTVRRVLDGRP